jgi:NADH-quinone oxidoreductase subunit C
MADDPEVPEPPPSPPEAAADKPPSRAPGEPLKGEVSRTDAPAAGASAAPVAPPREEPPAPKPENPAAATTATTSETSSATGQPTAPASAAVAATAGRPAAEASAAKPAAAAAKPAAPASAAAAATAAKPAAPHAPPAAAPPSGPTDPPPPADKTPPAFIQSLQSSVAGSVSQISYWVGDWTIIVPVSRLLEVARHLRDAPDALFDFCSDVTASDWPPRAERFDVIYCLYSTVHRHRIRVKVRASDVQPVPSMTEVWPSANWLEREVYDMFGVNFTGHPDRRRILMPEDWQGFPERKDYPLEGPGELLMENPLDWLKLRQAREEADIE